MNYLANIQREFEKIRNSYNVPKMEAYMKNKFQFLGVKATERNNFLKEYIKTYGLPDRSKSEDIVIGLWSLPYREYQYMAIDLANKLLRKPISDDILIIEYMLENKQWWDTVDSVSSNLVGNLFKNNSEVKIKYLRKWISSEDLWLNRAAILFQLKYKDNTQTKLLSNAIKPYLASNEFFHQKAIGWALRQYSKFNPSWVKDFIAKNTLAPLSVREASKYF